MKVRVEWYTGDVTIEEVTSENEFLYSFKYELNHSYSAPKEWCTKITTI